MNNSSGESRAGDKGATREDERQESGRGDEEINGGRGRVNDGEDAKLVVETKERIWKNGLEEVSTSKTHTPQCMS